MIAPSERLDTRGVTVAITSSLSMLREERVSKIHHPVGRYSSQSRYIASTRALENVWS